MGLKDKLEQNGSAFTYTAPGNGQVTPYPSQFQPTPNPLATPTNQGGLSLHANGIGAYATPGVSIAGNGTPLYNQVNAAWQSYKDGDPQNAIPVPGGNPGTDLDLEGIVPTNNAHGNPNLLVFYPQQNLPYDQNQPT